MGGQVIRPEGAGAFGTQNLNTARRPPPPPPPAGRPAQPNDRAADLTCAPPSLGAQERLQPEREEEQGHGMDLDDPGGEGAQGGEGAGELGGGAGGGDGGSDEEGSSLEGSEGSRSEGSELHTAGMQLPAGIGDGPRCAPQPCPAVRPPACMTVNAPAHPVLPQPRRCAWWSATCRRGRSWC